MTDPAPDPMCGCCQRPTPAHQLTDGICDNCQPLCSIDWCQITRKAM